MPKLKLAGPLIPATELELSDKTGRKGNIMSKGKKIFDDLRLLSEDEQVRLLASLSHEDLVTMWKYYSETCRFNEDHKIGNHLKAMICLRYVELVSDLGK